MLCCRLQNSRDPVVSWVPSASFAEVPGDVYNSKILQVLLQCLRNHMDSQGVDSLAGLKQWAGEAPVLGGR